jgi:hypothetical protein
MVKSDQPDIGVVPEAERGAFWTAAVVSRDEAPYEGEQSSDLAMTPMLRHHCFHRMSANEHPEEGV